jgi:threonine/homoserine/homoserine lactone efflux protein
MDFMGARIAVEGGADQADVIDSALFHAHTAPARAFVRKEWGHIMSLQLWLAYAAAVFVISGTPGPNMLLSITHGIYAGGGASLASWLGQGRRMEWFNRAAGTAFICAGVMPGAFRR